MARFRLGFPELTGEGKSPYSNSNLYCRLAVFVLLSTPLLPVAVVYQKGHPGTGFRFYRDGLGYSGGQTCLSARIRIVSGSSMTGIPTYELNDKDFSLFSRLVYEKCGIHLHEGKKELVRSRLSKRLRELRLPGFSHYLKLLKAPDAEDELVHMLDAISTNLTSFFREKRHFEFLETEGLTSIRERMQREERRDLHVWSAGCSSGEEPYSLAMCLQEAQRSGRFQLRILATDLSTRVLETAQAGVYPHSRVADLPQDLVHRYFLKGKGRMQGRVRICPEIRDLVTFRRFNLMDVFPSSLSFDVIFCRNVMIYFDKPTQELLVGKFFNVLRPGGYLFIGHSESLMGIQHRFRYVQPTIYLKS